QLRVEQVRLARLAVGPDLDDAPLEELDRDTPEEERPTDRVADRGDPAPTVEVVPDHVVVDPEPRLREVAVVVRRRGSCRARRRRRAGCRDRRRRRGRRRRRWRRRRVVTTVMLLPLVLAT